MTLWPRIEPHLMNVHAPSQYIGGEWNAVRKDPSTVQTQVVFAFPDAYTIGMSHLGLQIFYGLINARPDALCERAFAPWPDLEERMRRDGIPLFTVDSHRPVREFDIVGISLQSELGYTNVLNMLDLAGIPLQAADRGEGVPLVVGGGPCSTYPEPMADFFDLFLVGDGEEAMAALVDLHQEMKRQGAARADVLREAAKRLPGAYVPSLYDVEGGAPRPKEGAPARVTKAHVPDFEQSFFPARAIVPYAEVVFERINLEIMRGCPHRCRFCHAVSYKNKLRFRSVDALLRQAEEAYRGTGLDEIALTSLSSGDYPHLMELMARLNARFKVRHVSVSLPSLRIDEKLREIPPLLKTVRKSGFTLAPEAGTEAHRRVIRKPIRDEDLFETARAAFREGWRHIKLYFMVGLPWETEEDLAGIVETARHVSKIGKEVRGFPADVNVTVSPFVPKPHTPFQFRGQVPIEEAERRQQLLRALAKGSRVRLKAHNPRGSFVEAVLARGDRRVGRAIHAAWKRGARFDEWGEHFNFERWMEAFAEAGIDPKLHANRDIAPEEPLPWDVIDVGAPRDYLWRELQYGEEANRKRHESPSA